METSKNKAANNESARKLCLQLNISEAFQKFQDSIYSLLSYQYELSMFIKLPNLPSYTPKNTFAHLGGKLGNLPNKIR